MTRDQVEHHILWHCSRLSSSEHALLAEGEDGYRLQGVAVLPRGELPCHIEYAVAVDRRLGLEVGERASITAAWVRFPELDVVASEQWYRRLAIDRWQYTSGEYDYQLVTDPATGLVLSYGDDLWRAAATASR
jgi:hypothetical protein